MCRRSPREIQLLQKPKDFERWQIVLVDWWDFIGGFRVICLLLTRADPSDLLTSALAACTHNPDYPVPCVHMIIYIHMGLSTDQRNEPSSLFSGTKDAPPPTRPLLQLEPGRKLEAFQMVFRFIYRVERLSKNFYKTLGRLDTTFPPVFLKLNLQKSRSD